MTGAVRQLTLADLPLRGDLRGQVPYGAPQLDVAHPLNVNENPFPPSTELAAALGAAVTAVAGSLNRYPDRDAVALRAGLAAHLSAREGVVLDAAQVWAANGSNEIMLQLCQAFGGPGRSVLSFTPTYSMYPEYCRDTFTGWVTAPREADFTVDPDRAVAAVREHEPVLVLLASPNNPTGTALPLATVEALLAATEATGALVVVDEAYAEFRRPGTASALTLLAANPRLVVTRTMSKAFAMAGTRLGYLAAAPAVVDAVRIVRLPYHLSAVTQAVASTALGFADELLHAVDVIRAERDDLVDWLRHQGFEVAASDANFVLFGTFTDRHAVWQGLLDRGLLIREVGPPGWLRVSIGRPDENAVFRTALSDVVSELAAPSRGVPA